jgi:8-oxo-dGTP pyrophosphatase MutT (NUDIX family)
MRKSAATLAVVRRDSGAPTQWLVRWNAKWQQYNLVGGHVREGEAFRACLVREIEEELDLKERDDFALAARPVTRLEYEAWSASAAAHTAYTIELFEVQWIAEPARRKIEADSQNRWLAADEIRACRTADGLRISELVGRSLQCMRDAPAGNQAPASSAPPAPSQRKE